MAAPTTSAPSLSPSTAVPESPIGAPRLSMMSFDASSVTGAGAGKVGSKGDAAAAGGGGTLADGLALAAWASDMGF